MINARTFACGILLLSAWPLSAGEHLTVQVSPAFSFAPANLRVRATVMPDPDNRAIGIVAESPDFYRSSEIQLDGDRAPRTLVVELRGLPGGTYQVTAVLIGTKGERTRARQQVTVMANGEY